MFCRVFFHGFLHVVHLYARLQRMKTSNLQRFKAHIQARDVRPFARHAFRQDTATAADIEHFFTEQTAGALRDIAQTQRVNTVQRFELAFEIPPAGRHRFKFGNLFVVNVVSHRGFFGIHGRFYSLFSKTKEYIRQSP